MDYFVLHIWKSVCNARALDVSFLQWLLLRIDRLSIDVEKPVDTFKEWQKTKRFGNINVQEKNDFKDMAFNSETRTKMEKTLPKSISMDMTFKAHGNIKIQVILGILFLPGALQYLYLNVS